MKTVHIHILSRLVVLCCMALAAGCQNELETATIQPKYRVDAVKGGYDGVVATKAVKNNWNEGDELYIWYDDEAEPFRATYTGEIWDVTPPVKELTGTGRLYAVYGESATPTANGLSFQQGEICYTTAGTYTATSREIVLNLPMTQRPQGRIVLTGVSTGEELSLQKMQSVQTVSYTPGRFDFTWKANTLSAEGEADNTVAFYCLPLSDAGSNTTLYVEQNGTQYKRTFDNKKFTANKSITVTFQNDSEVWTKYNGSKIVYTTTDGKILSIKATYFGTNAQVISHNQTGENEFTIECDGTITEIPSQAFYNQATLKSIALPEGLKVIGGQAFKGCNLLDCPLAIPNEVTIIGYEAFSDCISLTGPLTLPKSLTKIGNGAFRECNRLTGPLVIPEGVTEIGGGAFFYCKNLTGSVTIPRGITTIESYTFWNCGNLTGPLTIPEGVTKIETRAFQGCSNLTGTLTIPKSVTTIENSAFRDCNDFTNLNISEGVVLIGEYAFSGCGGLTGSLTIPGSVQVVGHYAFSGCNSLTGPLTIAEGVTEIGYYAFENCNSLNAVTIPKSVMKIGFDAFRNCSSLMSLKILAGITEIEGEVFFGCSGLTSLTIPDGVTKIGNGAFVGCSGLTTVTIPESVTEIEDRAFRGCSSLADVFCKPATPPSLIGYDVFLYTPKFRLYVPTGCTEVYRRTAWHYADIIETEFQSVDTHKAKY